MTWFSDIRKNQKEALEKFQPYGPPVPGLQKSLDAPHRIVALLQHNGNMWVATEQRVYIVVNGLLQPVPFEITGDEK